MKAIDESNAQYYIIFNYILKFQAEAVLLKENHEEMFDIYEEKMKHIFNITSKSYSKKLLANLCYTHLQ